ncbi:hypothetical protein GUJ93_ZPchr0006g42003 [Zizania palustris]|uniref:Uncharacterized protein n=1 Tax=Zizania palustris TaxID=103762 RepID=A0A8J5W215_ZIZPA|nr:hypothetical protein GUJ93_ZPchr0006g42003 [Zizania palustris]
MDRRRNGKAAMAKARSSPARKRQLPARVAWRRVRREERGGSFAAMESEVGRGLWCPGTGSKANCALRKSRNGMEPSKHLMPHSLYLFMQGLNASYCNAYTALNNITHTHRH